MLLGIIFSLPTNGNTPNNLNHTSLPHPTSTSVDPITACSKLSILDGSDSEWLELFPMGDVGGGITSDVDIHRYSRHMLLPSFQRSGQEALSQAQVVVVGVGGLGSSCLLYLAAAGFGRIRVVDFDVVELSNLHRQVIHSEEAAAINLSKVDSALKQLRSLNSNVVYEGMNEKLCHDNVLQVLEGADVVVDATDNFRARYLLCDACFLQQIPLVSGSAVGFEGQITVYNPKNTTCYRCLYPVPSMAENCRSCSNAGVFGPVPGVIGCLQASEAIKMVVYLKGPNSSDDRASLKVNPLLGRQLYYDSLTGNCSNFDLPPSDPECCLCGEKSSILTIEDSKGITIVFISCLLYQLYFFLLWTS